MHITHNLDEFLENYDEWKKPILKGCIQYDFIYITCLK